MTADETVRELWNMACPQCGADDRIDIAATVWIRLCPDGTDITGADNGDHEWDNDHAAVCCACGHSGSVRDFSEKSDVKDRTERIAELNDLCRKAMGIAGKLVQTQGICALPEADQSTIREKVETFSDFTADNDPHGERDFGAFEHAGQKIFWKIDYYDPSLTKGSEDPSDPKQTTRVLTIMLAQEW